ncbi:MAG: PP2C family protein-serine/threonine phosphatase, partial [Prochlorothrix sp.]
MQPETPALSVSDMEGETALERPEITAYTYPWATIASCSDVGLVRSKNDDRLLVKAWPNDEALLLVVADGLGGSQSGGLAAELACATLAQLVEKPLPQTPKARYEALVEGFYAADQVILTEGGKSFQTLGMGCTAVAAIVTPQDYVHLYAGDSRLYHIRSGQVLYRSRDHSIVELLLASGRITEAEIPKHPMRSVVNSCLGGNRSSEHFT